jgi:hypothetical protein
MDLNEIKQTAIWELYEKGRNFHRQKGVYYDTDRNYRFYQGDQWNGVKLGDGVEPVVKNFIKPIVKYKVSVIHDNLYAIVYSSQNYEDMAFRPMAERYCEILNNYAAKVWEQGKMDFLGRRLTKDSAINGEGILYVDFDKEKKIPVNEIIKKNDVYFGNENDDDIQSQPYILIRKRMPVSNAVEFALSKGMSEDKIPLIVGDNDTFEESGDAAKEELDSMVTIVYKLYKDGGEVKFSVATRYCDIAKDVSMSLKLYPVAHFNWEEAEGSARGVGEVKPLIPNQIEVNRTEVRRVLTVKYQAYQQKVVDISKISNPQALNTVGGVIKVSGQTVDDVRKIVGTIPASQMSPDVKELQDGLIQFSRDLAGAGDTATGQVDPESASGRAILAVQRASASPLTEQRESYKNFIEDVAKIWLEYVLAHSDDGIKMEEKVTDPNTGKETIRLVAVPKSALEKLQASVKIEVTPKSVYDRFAVERTIENLFVSGLLHVDRVNELEVYGNLLDDDAVAPKEKILEAVRQIKQKQNQIAQIEAQAQLVQQMANQSLAQAQDPQAQQTAMAAAINSARKKPEEQTEEEAE